MADFGLRCLGVTFEKILAEKVAMAGKSLPGPVVHVENHTFGITNRDGTINGIRPFQIIA